MKAFFMKNKFVYVNVEITTSLLTSNIAQAINHYGLGKPTKSRINKEQYLLVAIFSLLTVLSVHAESVGTVDQNNSISKRAKAPSAFLATGTQAFNLTLPMIEIDLTTTASGIHKTGVVYQLPSPVTASQLTWKQVGSGYVTRIHVASEQAKRLRYHLVFNPNIPSMMFRVKGSTDTSPLDTVDHTFIHNHNMWLPITKGNAADLEIFVNGTKRPEMLFSIDSINVITKDSNNGNSFGMSPKSLGRTEQLEFDLTCFASFKEYPALQKAAKATALMSFIKNGSSYSCTGTLLNDKKSTRTPWFATANHCITDQATANTVTFDWFYQATTCGDSSTDAQHTQTSGGAKLLWSNEKLDGAFLKLNQRPPNGVSFIGWDSHIKVNEEAWGVHHPNEDHTMVSWGYVTALRVSTSDMETGTPLLLNEIDYIIGGIEQGSSGSGLFSIVNGVPFWKGTLFGGPANNYQVSGYSDFSSIYPHIKAWLVGPSVNPDIEQFYKKYRSYFGKKSGGNYSCYNNQYICQKFVTGKIIRLKKSTKSLYWLDGEKWIQFS